MKFLLLSLALITATMASAQKTTREQYIERFAPLAVADMQKYGIPASIKMAQALLESDNGNSRLALIGNNHFGIKCKSTWTGDTLDHDDDAPGECFRRYASAEDSWDDHARFLSEGDRYNGLWELDPKDYAAWAHGLKAAGYATNPRYPEMLIEIIEDNLLWLLDASGAEGLAGEGGSAGELAQEPEPEKPAIRRPMVTPAGGTVEGTVDPDNFKVKL